MSEGFGKFRDLFTKKPTNEQTMEQMYDEKLKRKNTARERAEQRGAETGRPWECWGWGEGYPQPGAIVRIKGSTDVAKFLRYPHEFDKHCREAVGKIGVVVMGIQGEHEGGEHFGIQGEGHKHKWVKVHILNVTPESPLEDIVASADRDQFGRTILPPFVKTVNC